MRSHLPPEILYHGTSEPTVATILAGGLNKMQRHHVHLAADRPTALKVAQRKGKSAILEIAAGKMAQAKICFYLSKDRVWLVDFVSPEYIKLRQ